MYRHIFIKFYKYFPWKKESGQMEHKQYIHVKKCNIFKRSKWFFLCVSLREVDSENSQLKWQQKKTAQYEQTGRSLSKRRVTTFGSHPCNEDRGCFKRLIGHSQAHPCSATPLQGAEGNKANIIAPIMSSSRDHFFRVPPKSIPLVGYLCSDWSPLAIM